MVDRENIKVLPKNAEGLKAVVKGYLDYGNIRFARVETDNEEILIHVDKDFDEKEVRLAFDSKDVSVYSTRIDMKLC